MATFVTCVTSDLHLLGSSVFSRWRYCPGWWLKDTEGLLCPKHLCMLNHTIFTISENYCPYFAYKTNVPPKKKIRSLNRGRDRQEHWPLDSLSQGGNCAPPGGDAPVLGVMLWPSCAELTGLQASGIPWPHVLAARSKTGFHHLFCLSHWPRWNLVCEAAVPHLDPAGYPWSSSW